MVPLLEGEKLTPISTKIRIRTEFSGAGTAEESMYAASELWNLRLSNGKTKTTVQCESVGDWCQNARHACSLNHPEACIFGDISMLAPKKLRKKLQEPLTEKA